MRRGGLCLPAGWDPREDLAETVGYLWLEEGREVWMLFKQRQREMGSIDLHPDLQTSNCGLKSKAEFCLQHSSHSFMSFMLVFLAIDTNPVWSCLSRANLLVCLVLWQNVTFRSSGGLSISLCGGFE